MIARLSFYFLLYTFLIFFGTPSFVLAAQIVAIAVCGFFVAKSRLASRQALFPIWFWVLLLTVSLYIAFSMIRGMANAPTTGPIIFRAALNFILTLCIPLIAYAYLRQGLLTATDVLHHFIFAVMVFSVVKCAIIVTVAILKVPIPILQLFFSNVFHTSPMFAQITPQIIRFSTASDYAVPFALFFWLTDLSRGWLSKGVCLLLFLACLFISFSRYVWMMSAVVLLLWCISLPRKTQFSLLLLALAASPVMANLVDFTPVIERFTSSATAQSDSIRVLQYQALSRDMDDYWLDGHGWASFRVDFVRDQNLPYSYEMQWLALFYQMGIVGVLFIASLIAVVLVPYYRTLSGRDWSMVVLFVLSVLAAFTNPVLLGRSPGAIYAFVSFYGLAMADRKRRSLSPVTDYLPERHVAAG